MSLLLDPIGGGRLVFMLIGVFVCGLTTGVYLIATLRDQSRPDPRRAMFWLSFATLTNSLTFVLFGIYLWFRR